MKISSTIHVIPKRGRPHLAYRLAVKLKMLGKFYDVLIVNLY